MDQGKWDLTSERRPPHRMHPLARRERKRRRVARPVGVRLGDGVTLRKRKASRRVHCAVVCAVCRRAWCLPPALETEIIERSASANLWRRRRARCNGRVQLTS